MGSNEGHVHYAVKALTDTSSTENFVSKKSLVDELGKKCGKHYKNKRVKKKDKLDMQLNYYFNGFYFIFI